MSASLIIPVAADKPDYMKRLPNMFSLNEEGICLCVEAAQSMDLKQFDTVYFTILKQHDDQYGISDMLKMQFRRLGLNNAKIVILDRPTTSQAETIHETINKEYIVGSICVKDADCSFKADLNCQGVVVYPLEKLTMVNPQHKSYVAVDEMNYITNIIEKRVVDHYFNAGGYWFDEAIVFDEYYERLADQPGLYLSHIIYAMLLDGYIFRPAIAEEYKDFEQTSKN